MDELALSRESLNHSPTLPLFTITTAITVSFVENNFSEEESCSDQNEANTC